MAVTTQGTAHLFGIQAGVSAVTNATVISFTKEDEHANQSTTENEIGNQIEDRMDDIHVRATLVLRPRALFSQLTLGALYTFDGTDYVIKKISDAQVNNGFVTYTYELLGREYITEA